MGYRIQYGGGKSRSKKKSNSIFFPLVLFLIAILLRLYIPCFDELTRSLLLSDKVIDVFSNAFSQESPYKDAVSVFCEEVFLN